MKDFLTPKLSNVVLCLVYNCTVCSVQCPSRFESFYLELTLASDTDFSKQHQKGSENENVT